MVFGSDAQPSEHLISRFKYTEVVTDVNGNEVTLYSRHSHVATLECWIIEEVTSTCSTCGFTKKNG